VTLFESVLTLLLLAILLLQVSRRLRIPYPTMLAAAGLCVAAMPWTPDVSLDPRLVLVVFIAPAILDAAFEFPMRAIRRYWVSLVALAVVAVLLTTAAVAWAGIVFAGMPIAAAIVLGAIVSPPDAAAAAAMLNRASMPRTTATVLKGESLLNDAVALFIFSIGIRMNAAGDSSLAALPQLAFAIPGGIILGIVVGRIATLLIPFLAGTLGGILFQFVATFFTWLIADRLGLSAILAVVATAMTAARYGGGQSARDRLHSNSVWSVVVFLLNILAFLLIGLQARAIVRDLDATQLRHAVGFGVLVLAIVVVVRIVWLMLYNRAAGPIYRRLGYGPGPTVKQGIVASWCGMRGMVTLAAALALPVGFPQRDLIVLSALIVVIGTLVIQGATLEPLVRLLKFPADNSRDDELAKTRAMLVKVAENTLAGRKDKAAEMLRWEFGVTEAPDLSPDKPASADVTRKLLIRNQREELQRLRREGRIEDETFRRLEQELDLEDVATLRNGQFDLVDT
jgi:CPA1 family monovalent cation:H+ antiporter